MEELKPFLRCANCCKRVVYQEIGFTGQIRYFCAMFGSQEDPLEVSMDDGCTFGNEGDPMTGYFHYDIQLGGHEAVNGY